MRVGNWIIEYEYRINKKGCEYFRTGNYEQAAEMLEQLQAKRPGVYSMQSRSREYNVKMEKQYRDWCNWR